jgi:hypothetical protein
MVRRATVDARDDGHHPQPRPLRGGRGRLGTVLGHMLVNGVNLRRLARADLKEEALAWDNREDALAWDNR